MRRVVRIVWIVSRCGGLLGSQRRLDVGGGGWCCRQRERGVRWLLQSVTADFTYLDLGL